MNSQSPWHRGVPPETPLRTFENADEEDLGKLESLCCLWLEGLNGCLGPALGPQALDCVARCWGGVPGPWLGTTALRASAGRPHLPADLFSVEQLRDPTREPVSFPLNHRRSVSLPDSTEGKTQAHPRGPSMEGAMAGYCCLFSGWRGGARRAL